MTGKPSLSLFIMLFAVLTLGFLSGCSRLDASPTSGTPVVSEPTPEASLPPTPTDNPASIWLVAGAQADPALRQEFSSWLAAIANQAGLLFLEVDEFKSSEVPEKLLAIVFLTHSEDLTSLAANMPETQFVLVTPDPLPAAANLSVIPNAPDQAAFLAGYLATLNAPDFRSGGLFVEGAAGSNSQMESFLNGGRYLCGRCSPVYTPIVPFPQTALVPSGSTAEGWQTAFDSLNQNRIEMLYVPAEGLSPEFLSYLSDKNIGILSNAPPPAGFESIWIATVKSDPLAALESLWPGILAGSGGQTVSAGVEISHVNPDNLSTGRQQMAEAIIPDLMTGRLTPLSVP